MEYKGSWKYRGFCEKCGEYKEMGSKYATVCISCSAWNKKGVTKKKDNILKAFRKKYKLPIHYPLNYYLLIQGKILIKKDTGKITKEKVEWLMLKRKDKLIETAKELLRLENEWRHTKHMKPLKKLGYEQEVMKGGFEK